jgi:hypothetical protein
LQIITKPFGGYRNILEIDDVHFEDHFVTPEMKQMLKVSDREQQLNVRFNMIAGSVGMRHTRWARLTIILFGLWTLGTSFLCFQKPDFLNLTVGICGLFILLDPQMLKASYLRLLVAVIPVT